MPVPIRSGHIFDGWFDARTGGIQYNEHTIITSDITLFAHWTKTSNVAEINGTLYATLQDAISAAPSNGTATTITLREDVSEELKVLSGRNITIDLKGTFETAAIDGTVSAQETNSQVVSGTETIDGSTYQTAHLESQGS